MYLKCVFLAVILSSVLRAADAPAPVPLAAAAAGISLPPGFRATLFAGEPAVVQPIAMATDARGRLWVVECLSYPQWTTNATGEDRVIILEDKDGDGVFDEKKVFWSKGRNLSGIAVGFGGVWLCSLPELIFIPDENGDDQPDGAPVVMLDGWDLKSQHNVFSNLNWGPDGWLYGCNGILSNSQVGAPGSPNEKRVPMNCGVWRFHPVRKVFEVVAHGTTNPWGIAFNDVGQIFVANCVIKHLFHVIPGARYERMFGQDLNPYSFELIPSIADHIHWAGGFWKTEGAEHPKNDLAGGGHAHSGAMIYSGDEWPAQYRGRFFTVNIHGHRVNQDLLVREGSGYVAKHAEDLLRVNDSWFRGISVIPAPDGSIYVSDWSDAGECHDYEDIHRDNGRIFKISYGSSRHPQTDLRRFSEADLVRNVTEGSGWSKSQSRLILQERGSKVSAQGRASLWNRKNLDAIWVLHALGELTTDRVLQLLQDKDEYLRAWTIQLALENGGENSSLRDELARMAETESSAVVRLYLASALQRLPPEDRIKIASGLVRHGEDATDHNLPSMIWFGLEPVVEQNEEAAFALLNRAELPLIRRFIAQRLSLAQKLNSLATFLLRTENSAAQGDVINGMSAALNGRREMPSPSGWSAVAAKLKTHKDPGVRDASLRLSLMFGTPGVEDELKQLVADPKADAAARKSALEGLINARQPGIQEILQESLKDKTLRHSAIRGLAEYDDQSISGQIIGMYSELEPDEKNEAINTLASREASAVALLEGIKSGQIPARDLSPFSTRQIMAFREPRVEALLKEIGAVRGLSGEKKTEIEKYKALLKPAAIEQANLPRGRAVFQKSCAACHTLFQEGGTLAPDLTGSQRSNIDYILENVVDPNAVVWDRYKATYFETSDDRLISGAVVGENENGVTIQTQTAILTLPRAEIVSRRVSSVSMMPEGLLEALQEQEVIDLIGYLQSPTQAPLPKE